MDDGSSMDLKARLTVGVKQVKKSKAETRILLERNAKLVVDGVPLFEIDVLENIYKVGGIDMLSKYKKNIGA